MTCLACRLAIAAIAAGGLSACERTMKDMYVQPRLGPDAASPLFADGKGSRPPPPGSVPMAMGERARTSSGRRGQVELAAWDAAAATTTMAPPTPELLLRGQERYDIFCAPCHSPLGDGDGMIARRGFPHPPTYHQGRLREAPDRHFYEVISQGYGVMPSYADRVTPPDRWAIVAYIRALQLSRDVPITELPATARRAVAAMPSPRASPPGVAPPLTASASVSMPAAPTQDGGRGAPDREPR